MNTTCKRLKRHILKAEAVAAAPANRQAGTMGNETDIKLNCIGGKL